MRLGFAARNLTSTTNTHMMPATSSSQKQAPSSTFQSSSSTSAFTWRPCCKILFSRATTAKVRLIWHWTSFSSWHPQTLFQQLSNLKCTHTAWFHFDHNASLLTFGLLTFGSIQKFIDLFVPDLKGCADVVNFKCCCIVPLWAKIMWHDAQKIAKQTHCKEMSFKLNAVKVEATFSTLHHSKQQNLCSKRLGVSLSG